MSNGLDPDEWLSSCVLGKFRVFCRLQIILKKYFRNTIRVLNGLDPEVWLLSFCLFVCMLGNFHGFCRLRIFFKINFFKNFFQEHSQIGSR